MEITALLIYGFDVIRNIDVFIGLIVAFTTIIFIGAVIPFAVTEGECNPYKYIKKWMVITYIALCLVFCLIPSRNSMIAMAIIPPVINNQQVQELPINVLNFINAWLKENTKEEK